MIGQISEGALLSLQLSSDLEEFALSDETSSWASPDVLRNSAEAIHKLFDEAFSIGLKRADDYRKKVEIFKKKLGHLFLLLRKNSKRFSCKQKMVIFRKFPCLFSENYVKFALNLLSDRRTFG